MSLPELLIISAIAALAYLTAAWLLSIVRRDAGVIDMLWGLGFVLLAVLYFALTDGYTGRKLLLLTLVSVWGLRLTVHIFRRGWNEPEDFRYSSYRETDGGRFWWTSFGRFFLIQGSAIWLISLPLLAAMYNGEPDHFTAFDAAGAALWAIGFLFEAGGDWQLTRFKADPANHGKVMRTGLWAYTRHPNYFGDALLWWGYFLIAAGTTDGYLTVFAPVMMTLILLRIAGVRLMEPHLRETRPGYSEYLRQTSAFVPWFPRRARQETANGPS